MHDGDELDATTLTRREALQAIALDVLERDGYDNFSVGAIARQAGIKTPSLYKHFANKQDIETSLVEFGLETQADTYRREITALGPDAPRAELVAMFARAYRGFAMAHPQLYRLMNDRPLPAGVIPSVYYSTHVDYDKMFTDRTVSRSLWAWAHGLVHLELSGRFPSGADLDGMWAVMVATMIQIAT